MNDINTTVTPTLPAYAKACGIAGIIFAVVALLVPVVGVLFITPIAIVLGCAALAVGNKVLGISVLLANAINLVVSPTFWLNVKAGRDIAGASSNRFLTYFDVLGLLVMVVLAVRKTSR